MVSVYLSIAMICIGQSCYPALVGKDTPVGEFKLTQRLVSDPLYRGSVLQFKETDDYIFSVHKVWRGRPKEKRDERLLSNDPKRRLITAGCINVSDEVFYKLIECCQHEKIIILP
jgi:hypothetical protein